MNTSIDTWLQASIAIADGQPDPDTGNLGEVAVPASSKAEAMRVMKLADAQASEAGYLVLKSVTRQPDGSRLVHLIAADSVLACAFMDRVHPWAGRGSA
jgi:hypothetical protein